MLIKKSYCSSILEKEYIPLYYLELKATYNVGIGAALFYLSEKFWIQVRKFQVSAWRVEESKNRMWEHFKAQRAIF